MPVLISSNDSCPLKTSTSLPDAAGRSPARNSFIILLVFLAIYLLSWGGHYTTGDGAHKVAWAKAMLFGANEAGIEPGPGGVYSKYGIGHSLLAMPPLAASRFIQRHTGIHCEAALYTLIFVANGAILMALIGYYLFHFYPENRVWLTVGVIGLATAWWPYTKLDFSEPLVTTVLFAGFVLMRFGRPTLGMLVGATAIAIRTDAILLISLLGLWSFFGRPSFKAVAKMGLAILPTLVLVAAGNYIRYGSIFDHGYAGETFSTPIALGLIGILLSAGKSVFLFAPPLILGFLGWKSFSKRPDRLRDALFFLAVFVVELLEYSRWWDWSSDDAWGVRFMIPGVVLMCIPAVEFCGKRRLFLAVGTVGLAVQLLAILPGSLDYLLLLRANNLQRQALYVTGQNRIDFEDIRFNPRYSQLAGNWILLRELLHAPPRPAPPGVAELSGTPLYDTLPPSSWSNAAQWDFIWVRHKRSTAPPVVVTPSPASKLSVGK